MRIVVDWAACDGNGVCTFEAPEVLELNDQDELIVLQEEFGPDLLPKVESAVRICPKRALAILNA